MELLSSLANIRLKKYFTSTSIFFIEDFLIYVPGRNGVAFLSYKQDFAAEKFGGAQTLPGAAPKARLRKAESYI